MKKIKNPTTALILNLIISLCITVVGIFIGGLLPPVIVQAAQTLFIGFIIVSFTLAIFTKRKNSSRGFGFSMGWVYLYSLFLGITLYFAIMYYLEVLGVAIVLCTLLGTIGFMLILALFSIKKGNDNILKLGPVLFAMTFAILIFSLVQVIFGIFTGASFIIAIISIILFSLWTVYDVYTFNKYKHSITTSRELAPFVLNIYVDFINLFLDILRIIAAFKD